MPKPGYMFSRPQSHWSLFLRALRFWDARLPEGYAVTLAPPRPVAPDHVCVYIVTPIGRTELWDVPADAVEWEDARPEVAHP